MKNTLLKTIPPLYNWGHTRPYNDYTSYIKNTFGNRVQKIAIDAGFTCPNRDGTKSTSGCIYCNNNTFNPTYCSKSKSITQQINEGIAFFSQKYTTQQYLAYFQAYSNTYSSFDKLQQFYEEALSHPLVIGLVIATRPDCVDDQLLDYLAFLAQNYYIVIEYGVESTLNTTLDKINRQHTYEQSVKAIEATARHRILTGVHLILGLPDESRNDILRHASEISKLPIHTLKLHQLQVVRNTQLANWFANSPSDIKLFAVDDYVELVVDFMELLHQNIIVERFVSEALPDLLIAPNWGLKNYEVVHKVLKRLNERCTWQGRLNSDV